MSRFDIVICRNCAHTPQNQSHMEGKFCFLKPDLKGVVPEIWKDVIKSTAVAGLGALGLFLMKQLPVVGAALKRFYALPLYAWILLLIVCLLIGFWIASAILRTKLRTLNQLADTDALTGLGNLRKQNVSLRKAIHDASDNEPLSIIYIDIDNFKAVNDVAGHDSGDYVLKQFAEVLNQNRKVTDIVCRCGGDEFLVMAPKTPRPGASMYAEKLRKEVATTQFKALDQRPDVSLTISAGVAQLNTSATESPDSFIKRAESAMRKAKEQRNHVKEAD
jgi:diguanylate cyclase (GGDEF)-like protein